MDSTNERMLILQMIEDGRISADEGLGLLQALKVADSDVETPDFAPVFDPTGLPMDQSSSPTDEPAMENEPGPAVAQTAFNSDQAIPETIADPAIQKWKRWWMIPLWVGVTITVFGALFMFLAQQSSGIGFWFVCASIPFALGLVVIVLAWQSRTAPWLHLRVQRSPGKSPERIAFSFPLPLQSAAWFLRTFQRWIPGARKHSWDQVILAVSEQANPDQPIVIQVDDAEGGETVEIIIG